MFAVVIVGFLVTETGSAQGCGRHWPLCDGQFTPPFDLHGVVEYGHRFISGVVGILVLWLAVWAWRRWGRRIEVRVLAALMLVFTFVQAALGAAAVLFPTSPEVLASHFGISLIAFGGTFGLDLRLHQAAAAGRAILPAAPPQTLSAGLRWLVYLGAVYIFLLVYLGAYVSHTGTGMLCGTSWPLCLGQIVPSLTGSVWIPFLHRVAAFVAVAWAIWLYVALRPLAWSRPDVVRGAAATLALILLQALSGWYLVASGLALGAIMLHVTLMTLLFAAVTYLVLQALPDPHRHDRTDPAPP